MQAMERRYPRYMKRGQVADLFGIGGTTLDRWRDLDILRAVTTPGGGRKYHTAEVMKLAEERGMAPREGWPAFFGLVLLTPDHDA